MWQPATRAFFVMTTTKKKPYTYRLHYGGDDMLVRVVGDDRITEALEIATRYGGIDGAHHKAWVIDQMVRILAGTRYESIVEDARRGEDGPNTYPWNEGIAP